MSFLPAVRREIATRPPNDPVRLTLEYLLIHGLGYHNSVPQGDIVAHLHTRGVNLSVTGFQQTVLAESRSAAFYIGSGNRGCFLIDTRADAMVMRDFYSARIQREQQNLNNLLNLANPPPLSWGIPP
jgi:hypothetical protein